MTEHAQDRRQREAEAHRRDAVLATAAAGGDSEARRVLATRLVARVNRTVRYLGVSSAESEDMVQLALVEILRVVGSFRGESRLETWADRIAVRTAMRQLRRQRQDRERLADDLDEQAASIPDPEESLSRARIRACMARLLERLTPERRAALVLREVHGFGIQEIAELTESPVNTVKDRIKKGRRQLRRLASTDAALREWAKTRQP